MFIGTKNRRIATTFATILLAGNHHHGGSNLDQHRGIGIVDAFVLPSSPLSNTVIPNFRYEGDNDADSLIPLQSIKFVKSQTTYGDTDGAMMSGGSSGILDASGGLSGGSIGFGGTSSRMGSRRSGARRNRFPAWWSSSSAFSRSTPTSMLAAGSLESWPVVTTDEVQILVKKGDDIDTDEDLYSEEYPSSSSSNNVRARLERWQQDLSLPIVSNGYEMMGNQMQPSSSTNDNDLCTQSVQFDVADGELYPFSGTVSVPSAKLTVDDPTTGNPRSVMMVLHNPDNENDGDDYGYHNDADPNTVHKKKKSRVLEARVEPSFTNQQQSNNYYNSQQQDQQSSSSSIPARQSQSFSLDATDPSSAKINIHIERDDDGRNNNGGFQSSSSSSSSPWEARVEIYHGFRDEYGNIIQSNNSNKYGDDYDSSSITINNNNNGGEDAVDRRLSMDVATTHPTFSSTIDTMPPNLLYRHTTSKSASS